MALNLVDRTSHKSLSSPPSLSTAQVDNMSRSASPLLKVEYVQSSNKALVEKIHAALEFNEEKFSAFKLISTKYLRDLIDTAEQRCQFRSVPPGMAETFHTNSKNGTNFISF
jgi:hypothetical protein